MIITVLTEIFMKDYKARKILHSLFTTLIDLSFTFNTCYRLYVEVLKQCTLASVNIIHFYN